MSEPLKSASDVRGVPEVVLKRFDLLLPTIVGFALLHKLRVERYEGAKPGDDSWFWNLHGRVFGRDICLQVWLNEEWAKTEMCRVFVMLKSADVGFANETSWVDLLDRQATKTQLDDALKLCFGAAIYFAKGTMKAPFLATA